MISASPVTFTLPDHLITSVMADEILYVAQMGNGRALLCGKKVTLDVPGVGLHLGMKFIATRNNRLIPANQNVPPKPQAVTTAGQRRVMPFAKFVSLMKRTVAA